jgi:hypothetical protein
MDDLNDKVSNSGLTAAGKLSNTEWNQIPSEIQSIIQSTGQTLAPGTLTQLGDAIAAMTQGGSFFGTDIGSSTAYSINSVNSVHYGSEVGLFTGMHVRFRPANNSTSISPTLNAFGSGIKNILSESASSLKVGDLNTTRDAECRYDGTQWLLLDRSKILFIGPTYDRGYIRGLLMEIEASPNNIHDMRLNIGECSNHDGTFNLDLASAEIKQLDVHRDGNVAGMYPSSLGLLSSLGATWFRVFVIGGATATTSWGVDISPTATNIMNDATTQTLVTYNKYRQVGWIRWDTSTIIQFKQDANDLTRIDWEDPQVDHANDWNSPNMRNIHYLMKLTAPPSTTAKIRASFTRDSGSHAGAASWRLSRTDTPAIAANRNTATMYLKTTTGTGRRRIDGDVHLEIWVDASSEIRSRVEGSPGDFFSDGKNHCLVTSKGYIYTRGIND